MSQRVPTRINNDIKGQPPIGGDTSDTVVTLPVISDGNEQVWRVIRNNGNGQGAIRTAILLGEFIAEPQNNEVVLRTVNSTPPRPTFEWILLPANRNLPVETFSIIDPGTGRAWTLNSPTPKTKVVLEPANKVAEPPQLFHFHDV